MRLSAKKREHCRDQTRCQRPRHLGTTFEKLNIGMRVDNELLREGLSLLCLNASAHHNVALFVQCHEVCLCLGRASIVGEDHGVLAGVHCHNAVIPKLLTARLQALLTSHCVHDPCAGFRCSLVGVNDSHLRILQVGEDVGFERHCGAECVVAMDHQQEHGIIVGKVGHRESPGAGIPNFELELVTGLQGRQEVLAGLVLHWRFTGQLLTPVAVDVKGSSIGVCVAHAELVLEFESLDEALGSTEVSQ
mmetsp:Transcript_13871/g.26475  ORF Transcript_13871/g.26475 Transcript_13871/m.26475 type:complete len:248 (+) Transcript_13871:46-789(+)